jgi:hypothetical protein
MSWKLLQQQTLADAFVSEHDAIKELEKHREYNTHT